MGGSTTLNSKPCTKRTNIDKRKHTKPCCRLEVRSAAVGAIDANLREGSSQGRSGATRLQSRARTQHVPALGLGFKLKVLMFYARSCKWHIRTPFDSARLVETGLSMLKCQGGSPMLPINPEPEHVVGSVLRGCLRWQDTEI